MTAGCIDRFARDSCGDCRRHDACASIFKAFRGIGRERRQAMPDAGAFGLSTRFLSFLGQLSGRPRAARQSFRREVEERIEPLLASGPVRIDRVARELGYSRQTLYRRLKEEGVTFEGLLDGLRRRRALQLLREEKLSVKEAAYRLGFSDPSAFSRAFKRWTGSSPTATRGA